jgi:hypothetical protein
MDFSWIRPGITIKVGKMEQGPDTAFVLSRSCGEQGSIMRIEGDYATVYIPTNITKGRPPQERVPLIQCERI